MTALARQEPVNPAALAYVNRLSDYLFVLARAVNAAGRRRAVGARKEPLAKLESPCLILATAAQRGEAHPALLQGRCEGWGFPGRMASHPRSP
jgi:hypothetical protein